MAYVTAQSTASPCLTSRASGLPLAGAIMRAPGILGWFNLFIRSMRAWQAQRLAERELAALPASLRKDLGWPTVDTLQKAQCSRVAGKTN